MRSFGFNRRSIATAFRRTPVDTLREFLFKVGKAKAEDVWMATSNRRYRRTFSRMQAHRGRGYTKPMKGRSHTRGSGKTRHH